MLPACVYIGIRDAGLPRFLAFVTCRNQDGCLSLALTALEKESKTTPTFRIIIMDWATQFDVTESFQALEDVDETISVQDLQTIYLGLGFLPTRFATVENLTRAVHRQQTMERDAKQKQLQVLPSEGTIEEDDNGQNASSLVVGKRTSLYTEQLMDGRLTLEQTLLFLSKVRTDTSPMTK